MPLFHLNLLYAAPPPLPPIPEQGSKRLSEVNQFREGPDKCWQLIDLVFCVHVTDASNVPTMKTFLYSVIDRMAIGQWKGIQKTQQVRVALVNYWYRSNNLNDKGYNVLYYNSGSYNDEARLKQMIANMAFTTGGQGDVRQCLTALKNDIQIDQNGYRYYAESMLFIATDNERSVPRGDLANLLVGIDEYLNNVTALMVSENSGRGRECQPLEDILSLTGFKLNTTQHTCREINRFTWRNLNSDQTIDWAYYEVCPSKKEGDYIISTVNKKLVYHIEVIVKSSNSRQN